MSDPRKPEKTAHGGMSMDAITNGILGVTTAATTLQALIALTGAHPGIGGLALSAGTGYLAVKFGRKAVDAAFARFQRTSDAKAPALWAEFEALAKGNFIKGVVERTTTAMAGNARTGAVSTTEVKTVWYVREEGKRSFTRMDDKQMREFERALAKTPGATLNKLIVDGETASMLRYQADGQGNLKLHGDTPEAPAKVVVAAGGRKTVEYRSMGVDVTGDVLARQPAADPATGATATTVTGAAPPSDSAMGPWGPRRA